jgi:DNA-binding NarL/FixJ family response regulator
MSKVRVLLVDDHMILREGLRKLVEVQPDICVVGEAEDGEAALEALAKLQVDVVVLDISMPKLGGVEATVRMRAAYPQVRILALTAHEDSEYVQLMLRAGAAGYLLKRAAASDLVRAIRAVMGGQLYLDTTVGVQPSTPVPSPETFAVVEARSDLSKREADVLRMIALGYSMKRMAADLDISPRTLETYKKRAMQKLAMSNRADIVRYALRQGWLTDG